MTVDKIKDGWVLSAKMRAPGNAGGMCPTSGKSNGYGHVMTKWPHHPNLRKKPDAPSKGRGPVQRAIRRAFMASGAEVLNSTEIYNWAHGRRRFGRRKSMPFGVYSRTLRTLRAMCEPVGRAPTAGRPWCWRLRTDAKPQ